MQPKSQGEVGPVMAQLAGTTSAEEFKALFLSVCRAADVLLKEDAMVVDVRPPVKIFGDIHGQLQDLLRLFSSHGFPITGSGGDIDVVTCVTPFPRSIFVTFPSQVRVQRRLCGQGPPPARSAAPALRPQNLKPLPRCSFAREPRDPGYQLSVSSTLQASVANPNPPICRCRYGYSAECRRISSAVGRFCPLHSASLDIFEWLPVAAVVSGAVLVLHGGIGDGLWSLDQVC